MFTTNSITSDTATTTLIVGCQVTQLDPLKNCTWPIDFKLNI